MEWSVERGDSTHRPRDVTEQFLEFAATGRVRPLDSRLVRRARRKPVAVLVVAAAVLCALAGVLVVVDAYAGDAASSQVAVGGLCTLIGLSAILPASRLASEQFVTPQSLAPRPGAVLPAELVRVGHWIHRDDAWVRVLEAGLTGDDSVTVLVSTGAVIDLTGPVTVAGGPFHRLPDPVGDLRS